MDQCLASQMKVEQRASFAVDEVKILKDLLSSTHKVMVQAEQKEARLELEIQVVNHFKRSLAYDALLLREFQRGMVSTGEFFNMKNRATDRARANWSLSIKNHVDMSMESLRV